MMRGVVNATNEAILRIRLRGPGHPGMDVDSLIDSGFTSTLTLPAATIAALGLIRLSGGSAVLADGSSRQFDTYAAEMSWDGRWRRVLAYGLGDATLLGMELLAGHELRIAVRPGGAVEVTPLP